jgi:hypothetical protein
MPPTPNLEIKKITVLDSLDKAKDDSEILEKERENVVILGGTYVYSKSNNSCCTVTATSLFLTFALDRHGAGSFGNIL